MTRVIAVTGASAGVGRATATAFGARGDAVALLARSPEGLEGARRDVERAGGRALICPVDVSDAEGMAATAERIERELGPIDVWVNNAMASTLSLVRETPAEDFRRVMEVVYLGYVHGTLAVLDRMRARDRGVIVMVGSALAYRAIPLQAAYCAGKHASRAFTDALRVELLAEGSAVKVVSVHLPGMNTPQFGSVRTTMRRHPMPVPPIFQPEIAADAITFAADHPRREVWVTSTTAKTILGDKLAPRLADRVLARSGISGQQTEIEIPADRPDYLFEPLPGDRGAHGIFDDQAKARSLSWLATRHRVRLGLGAAVVGAVGGGVAAVLRR